MDIQKRRIILYASDVAAACGMNKYKAADTVLAHILARQVLKRTPEGVITAKKMDEMCAVKLNENVTVTTDMSRAKREIAERTGDEHLRSAIENAKTADEIVKCLQAVEVAEARIGGDETLAVKAQALRNELMSGISHVEGGAKMSDHVQSQTQKAKGIAQESSILNTFEGQTSIRVAQRNDQSYELYVSEMICIRGRCDGRTESGEIVEVKQRKARLFNFVPLYEKVQCEVYCRMTGAPRAIHVERYIGTQQKVTRLERDDQLWEQIVNGLTMFEEKLKCMLSCPTAEIEQFVVYTSQTHGPI